MIEFASFGMLLSLAAAAIPYLLMRRRQKVDRVIAWPTLRLLREAIAPQARRMDWLQWLLLALRTLALVLVALAVANPFLKSSGSRTTAIDKVSLYCYFIDCSPSMARLLHDNDASPTLHDRAKELIAGEIQRADQNDLVAIIALADTTQLICFDGLSSRQTILKSLDELQIQAAPANVEGIESVTEVCLQEAYRRTSKVAALNLQVVSDFSVHEWSTDRLEQLDKRIKTPKDLPQASLPRSTKISFLPVPDNGSESAGNALEVSLSNLSVTRLAMDIRQREDNRRMVMAEVLNTGTVESEPVTTQWWIDDSLNREVQLPALTPAQSTWIELELPPLSTGGQRIEFRLPKDHLSLDNARFLVAPRTVAKEAILVAREELQSIGLAAAYAARGGHTRFISAFTPEMFAESDDASREDLHLIDPANIDPSWKDSLIHQAELGRSIFVWIGPTWDAQSTLLDWPGLPSSSASVDERASDRLAVLTWPRSNDEEQELNVTSITIPITKFWRLDQLKPSWQEVVRLDNDAPFAVQVAIGKGTITWITTPPTLGDESTENEPWNALVKWPTFVPLLERLQMSSRSTLRTSYVAGQQVVLPASRAGTLDLILPNNQSRAIAVEQDSNMQTKVMLHANQLGFYSLRQPALPTDSRFDFVVNLDRNELQFEQAKLPVVVNDEWSLEKKNATDADQRRPLFQILIAVAIIMLLLETLIASLLVSRPA